MAYRYYIARSLQLIPQDKYVTMSLNELLNSKPADNRTGDEIVVDVMEQAGLSFGE